MDAPNRLEIAIAGDNAAFDESPRDEFARILRDLAARIESDLLGSGEEHYLVRDINGNTCGRCLLYHRA